MTEIPFANKNFLFTKLPLIAETTNHGSSYVKVFLEIDEK